MNYLVVLFLLLAWVTLLHGSSVSCPPCLEERIIVDKDQKCLEWDWIEVDKNGNPIDPNILRANYPIGGPNLIQNVPTQKVVESTNTLAAIISVSVVGSFIALVLVTCSVAAIIISIALCVRYRKKQYINTNFTKGDVGQELLMASRDPELNRKEDDIILLQPRTTTTMDEEFEDD